jgi:uncharacterized protein (DUF1810 family)
MSSRYAISSLEEAKAYLAHPVLGARLAECAKAAIAAPAGASAEDVFGPVDALKLRSSMTLFLRANPDEGAFAEVLRRWWEGIPDTVTDNLLAGG